MYRAVTFAAMSGDVALDEDSGRSAVSLGRQRWRSASAAWWSTGSTPPQPSAPPEVTAAVSKVAANSEVRTELRARQQDWAAERGGGVIEGRDIGSVVFPDAHLKLYLTASPRTRAERRVAEVGGDVDEIESAMAARDHYDSNRSDSPLVLADGSIVVDTTGMGIDEVLAHIQTLMNDGTDET